MERGNYRNALMPPDGAPAMFQLPVTRMDLANALMRRTNGTGSHWYPSDQEAGRRVYPTPQFIPDHLFEDNIFAMPLDPAARRGLGFDRMGVEEQNPERWLRQSLPSPTRGLR
jgi:hypothetical protein